MKLSEQPELHSVKSCVNALHEGFPLTFNPGVILERKVGWFRNEDANPLLLTYGQQPPPDLAFCGYPERILPECSCFPLRIKLRGETQIAKQCSRLVLQSCCGHIIVFVLIVLFCRSPYIIGVRDKSRKGPFSSKELSLSHYFR